MNRYQFSFAQRLNLLNVTKLQYISPKCNLLLPARHQLWPAVVNCEIIFTWYTCHVPAGPHVIFALMPVPKPKGFCKLIRPSEFKSVPFGMCLILSDLILSVLGCDLDTQNILVGRVVKELTLSAVPFLRKCFSLAFLCLWYMEARFKKEDWFRNIYSSKWMVSFVLARLRFFFFFSLWFRCQLYQGGIRNYTDERLFAASYPKIDLQH